MGAKKGETQQNLVKVKSLKNVFTANFLNQEGILLLMNSAVSENLGKI